MNSDRIVKTAVLKAPRTRVWQAIADAAEFGAWFGVAFDGGFAQGAAAEGRITSPGPHAGARFTIVVERIEPEMLFSYRWHPHAVDPAVDYSAEPMTLVEFQLEDVPEGTRLTIVESGFDRIPPSRVHEALDMNASGWEIQMGNVARYVAS